jgi:hypothetical protein
MSDHEPTCLCATCLREIAEDLEEWKRTLDARMDAAYARGRADAERERLSSPPPPP